MSDLLEKEEQSKNKEVVIQVCQRGDPLCIEVEIDMKMSYTRFTDLIR